ncbi:MAG: DNA-processing protein DprA [Bacteroidota bacterium]
MQDQKWIYRLGLCFLEGAGSITLKKLMAYCGGEEAIFHQSQKALEKIPGIGRAMAKKLSSQAVLSRAEAEFEFSQKNAIGLHFYRDENYPNRLKHCDDGPVILFSKGNVEFNSEKCISVVGTRSATQYGSDFTRMLIEKLKDHYPLVISGLAYGIDVAAHKAALKNELSTIGVMAHGLDKFYPAAHKNTARAMMEKGGIISEFTSGTPSLRDNFPARNRIIAGMSDAIIVVESAYTGGSMITAEFGNQYNRDVFAVPGRVTDGYSEGCHRLIKTHKAHIFTDISDLEYIMNWEKEQGQKAIQTQAFVDLNPKEEQLINLLKLGSDTIDNISYKSEMPISEASAHLLNLEFNGLVRSLPGKVYELV